MIRAAGRLRGKPMLMLGLSGENVTRLVAGEPIAIPAEDVQRMGLPVIGIVIYYGKTEDAIVAELAAYGLIDSSTPAHFEGGAHG